MIQRVLGKSSPTSSDTGSKPPPSPPTPHDTIITRTLTYFRGLGRREVWQMRRLFKALGIPSQAVQFVSSIGANVTELIILDSFKGEVVKRLATVNVLLDPTFDPLSPTSFTDASTIQSLGLEGKSKAEQLLITKQVFLSRLDSMLLIIAEHRHGLISFLRSLRNAIEKGTPIVNYFHSPPTTLIPPE